MERNDLIESVSLFAENMQLIKTWGWEGPHSLPPEDCCAPLLAGISTRYTSSQNVGLPGGMCSVLLDLHFLRLRAGGGGAGGLPPQREGKAPSIGYSRRQHPLTEHLLCFYSVGRGKHLEKRAVPTFWQGIGV